MVSSPFSNPLSSADAYSSSWAYLSKDVIIIQPADHKLDNIDYQLKQLALSTVHHCIIIVSLTDGDNAMPTIVIIISGVEAQI